MTSKDKEWIDDFKREVEYRVDDHKSEMLADLIYDMLQDCEEFKALSMDRKGEMVVSISQSTIQSIEETCMNL
jgi:predicted metal-dependent hydrolase